MANRTEQLAAVARLPACLASPVTEAHGEESFAVGVISPGRFGSLDWHRGDRCLERCTCFAPLEVQELTSALEGF
jgi:hypothetical protein